MNPRYTFSRQFSTYYSLTASSTEAVVIRATAAAVHKPISVRLLLDLAVRDVEEHGGGVSAATVRAVAAEEPFALQLDNLALLDVAQAGVAQGGALQRKW
jgi:hypothetical protein